MRLLEGLAHFVTRRRGWTALLLLLVTVLAAVGYRYQPPPDEPGSSGAANRRGNPMPVATDDLAGRPADCLLVVETEDLFRPDVASALRAVVAAIEQQPYIESITWVDTVPVLNVFGLREPLLPPSDASAAHFAEVRERVLKHPLVIGQLLSEDGRTLVMPIRFDWLFVTSDADVSTELLKVARSTAAGHDVPMQLRLTGRVPLYLAHKEAFDRNQTKFQLIAYALVFLLSLVLFRGLRAVLIVALAPALGVFWTLGLLNWLGELSNPLTNVVLPVLLTMVGLTDGVHLMLHIRNGRTEGLPPEVAASRALTRVGTACFLTSLTTAIGFASLLLAHSEFVIGFGRGCAIGVVVTFLAVVITIPLASSTRLGWNLHRGHEHDLVGRGLRHCGWIMDGILRHPRAISAVAILVTAALSLIALQLRPDDRTRDSQPTGSEAYQALEHCDRALGGTEFVRVELRWPQQLRENDEQILHVIQRVEDILRAEPTLHYPLSILSVLAALPGEESPTARLPFLQLLPTRVKATYLDHATRRAVVTVRIQDLGIATYNPVFRRVEQRLAELQRAYPGVTLELAGDPVNRGRNLHTIVMDLVSSLGGATIVIFVVLGIAYRSLRLGLVTIIPNVFPLAATATMMVWLDHPLELASVCSFTVCLGIAVDDTIHFLTRFREERAQGKDVPTAIKQSFEGVGAAMIITTLILVTGFGTVMTSDLPGHRYFAMMAVATLSTAVIGDLVFLPALLMTFPGGARDRDAASRAAQHDEPAAASLV